MRPAEILYAPNTSNGRVLPEGHEGPLLVESTLKTKSGKIIPVELSLNHLVFEGKEYLCGFARDIYRKESSGRKPWRTANSDFKWRLAGAKEGLWDINLTKGELHFDDAFIRSLRIFYKWAAFINRHLATTHTPRMTSQPLLIR